MSNYTFLCIILFISIVSLLCSVLIPLFWTNRKKMNRKKFNYRKERFCNIS